MVAPKEAGKGDAGGGKGGAAATRVASPDPGWGSGRRRGGAKTGRQGRRRGGRATAAAARSRRGRGAAVGVCQASVLASVMLWRRALAGHTLYLAGSGRPRPDPSPPRRMAACRRDGYAWTARAAAARCRPASCSAGGFYRWWVSSLLMGGDVRMWKWRDDGLCWREAGMRLDVRDGDFLIVGRVFSLSSVSPLGRTLFWSWGMLGGGRRLRLAVEVCGG
ncbi:hypothetical protein OsI_17310 [Oryza sativa Indica Group]|uniref:Uncharacterized protein n=1 Tax=Oryza sativa subsp. indica TaxID=39946 RepID=A2XXA5_ORYSI|nr:hypothetical protein OsI_17310 [Oryza sativa Indica Group]